MLWVVISFSLNIGKTGSFLERGKITQMWVFSSPFLSGIAEKGREINRPLLDLIELHGGGVGV